MPPLEAPTQKPPLTPLGKQVHRRELVLSLIGLGVASIPLIAMKIAHLAATGGEEAFDWWHLFAGLAGAFAFPHLFLACPECGGYISPLSARGQACPKCGSAFRKPDNEPSS